MSILLLLPWPAMSFLCLVDHIEEHLTAAEALMQRALDEPEVAESPVTTIFFFQEAKSYRKRLK
jgi:hypothetical protein